MGRRSRGHFGQREARRDFVLFKRKSCFQCHGGWNFGGVRFEGGRFDNRRAGVFFNTGVSSYESPNRGLYERTGRDEDVGKFGAPTLRNIALTAPYMHDGSLATLESVIDHYAAGDRMPHANKTRILRPFQLTEGEKQDLIEFLKSLTDEELLRDPRWSDPWTAHGKP